MKAFQITPGGGTASLARTDVAERPLQPHEVRIRTRASSLNYRDLMFAWGNYINIGKDPLVPLTDGAGEIVELGSAVSGFAVGDRVIHAYFTAWDDGAPDPRKVAHSFGTHVPGTLAERFIAPASTLVRMPESLSFEEASVLSCVGTTVWNSFFVDGGLKPGATVLLLGTGGVSIFALQLARLAGLRTIVTSSSNAKLERVRALGADAVINYVETPEWQDAVLELTGGRGVDLTVETGGAGTLGRSLTATRTGGTVSVIGGTSGFGGTPIDVISVIAGAKRLSGILVGSRAMLEDLCRFVDATGFKPLIDQVYGFDDAAEAFARIEAGRHFGKLVVRGA